MKSSKNSRLPAKRKIKPKQLADVYRDLRGAFGYQHWWPGETPFEVIVGAILTQNTAWTNVEKAIVNLKAAKVLTPEALDRISESRLARLIRPAGYFNLKAKRLKGFIHFLKSRYGGSLERLFARPKGPLREELLGVYGIGPETADSILLYAGQKASFVIDAYTRRVFSRHGLMDESEGYDAWKALFEGDLRPQIRLYNDFHAQIVHVAKHFCKSRQAACEGCPLRKYL